MKPSSPSSAARSQWARVYGAARVVLLGAIVAWLGWQIYSGRSAIAALNPRWNGVELVAAFLAAILGYQCLFAAWLLMLKRAGYFSSAFLRAYARVWWISYLYRYVPGKVLLVAERSRMGMSVGIPRPAGVALAIVESLLAILAGAVVSLLSITYYAHLDTRILIVILCFSVGIIFLVPIGFRWLCNLHTIRDKYPELQSVAFGPADIVVLTIPYVFHYLLLGVSFFLLARGLHPFTLSAMPGLIGVYALAHVFSLITFLAPGGLGVREGALAAELGHVLPGGIAETFAIGLRVWFTLIELLCCLAVVLLCPRLNTATGKRRDSSAQEPTTAKR